MSTNLILTFHKVPSTDWFKNTLTRIKSLYRFISIKEIESYFYDNSFFNNRCHICFDDGNKTVYENAFPVLREMKVPATLFISPKVVKEECNYWFQELDYISNDVDEVLIKEVICDVFNFNYIQIREYMLHSIFKSMKIRDILSVIECIKEKYNITITEKYNISIDQLYELMNSDLITIGAHTMNHPILTNETFDDAEKEIQQSVEEMFKMIGSPIKYFAYPNGEFGLDYNLREQLILKKNNLKLSFSFDRGFFNKKSNRLSIPRDGFSGSKRENTTWVLGKLFLFPIWDVIRSKKEFTERNAIKELGIF